MKLADRITAVLLIALSLWWIQMAVHIPFPAFARVAKMGPGHYPMAVAGLQIVLAIWLLWETFLPNRYPENAARKTEESKRNPLAKQHLVVGFGLFVGYVILVPLVGFGLATTLFVFGFVRFIGRYTVVYCGLLSLAIPAVIWFIFAYLLTVPLPKGPWGF